MDLVPDPPTQYSETAFLHRQTLHCVVTRLIAIRLRYQPQRLLTISRENDQQILRRALERAIKRMPDCVARLPGK